MEDFAGFSDFMFPSDLPGDARSKLLALADMIELNPAAGTITIRNGKASLTLREDGFIQVTGVKIQQSAERSIRLDAATIDLN